MLRACLIETHEQISNLIEEVDILSAKRRKKTKQSKPLGCCCKTKMMQPLTCCWVQTQTACCLIAKERHRSTASGFCIRQKKAQVQFSYPLCGGLKVVQQVLFLVFHVYVYYYRCDLFIDVVDSVKEMISNPCFLLLLSQLVFVVLHETCPRNVCMSLGLVSPCALQLQISTTRNMMALSYPRNLENFGVFVRNASA